jgi:hypothetical protein
MEAVMTYDRRARRIRRMQHRAERRRGRRLERERFAGRGEWVLLAASDSRRAA